MLRILGTHLAVLRACPLMIGLLQVLRPSLADLHSLIGLVELIEIRSGPLEFEVGILLLHL